MSEQLRYIMAMGLLYCITLIQAVAMYAVASIWATLNQPKITFTIEYVEAPDED